MWEYLHDRGIFDFGAASDTIQSYLNSATPILPEGHRGIGVVSDLMHLNAAEIAVLTTDSDSMRRRRLDESPPIFIPTEAAAWAVTVSDSGPFVGHDPQAAGNLWDVTLFSSDASKLAWLSGAATLESLRERFIPAIRELSRLYAEMTFVAAGPVEQLGPLLPFRAILWSSKLATLAGETPDRADIDTVFDAARERPQPIL